MSYRTLYVFNSIFQWVIIFGGHFLSKYVEHRYEVSQFTTISVHLGCILLWGILGIYWYEKWTSGKHTGSQCETMK